MKKLIALLIVCALALSLAACGGKNDPTEPASNDETTAEAAPMDTETTEPEETEQTDEDLAAELTERLTGTWGCPGDGSEDFEQLTFNADGTGSYRGVPDKQYTFTYVIHIDHRTYANGAPYVEYMIKLDYDNGVTEDNIFFFTDSGKLAFHNAEDGGYTGQILFIDSLVKE